MSVTFTIVDSGCRELGVEARLEPCLCAQLAACFCAAFEGGVAGHGAELAAAANPACRVCDGTGVERVAFPRAEWALNLSNANACALVRLLGLGRWECGHLDLTSARSCLVRGARALEQLEGSLGAHAARPEIEIRAIHARWSGSKPAFVYEGELTLDGLRARVLRLVDLIARGVNGGGVALVWS